MSLFFILLFFLKPLWFLGNFYLFYKAWWAFLRQNPVSLAKHLGAGVISLSTMGIRIHYESLIGAGVPGYVHFIGDFALWAVAPVVCVFGMIACWEALLWLVAQQQKKRGSTPPGGDRRRFFKRSLVALSLVPSTLYGVNLVPYQSLEVVPLKFKIQGLKRPLRMAFLSDFHMGNLLDPKIVEDALKILKNLKPDYILLGGDIIDHNVQDGQRFEWFFQEIQQLSPLIGVLGNHDFFADVDQVVPFLRQQKIQLLRDETTLLPEGLQIWGTRDLTWEKETNQGWQKLDPSLPTLVLSHNPDLMLKLPPEALERVSLMLSGHTHGGQIRVPGIGAVLRHTDARMEPGLIQLPPPFKPVVVSKGLGYAGFPLRVNCPPDLVVLDLV